MPEQPLPVETMAAHAGFVRAVARAILGDPDLADDVVQDTFVVALERGESRRGPLRPWLGGIARRRAVDVIRTRSAIRRREQRRSRPEATSGVGDLSERAAQGRALVGVLLELDERYRDVILLRFYEDLPPREVALRLSVPVETVRTRTRRGLARLRQALDDQHGQDKRRTRALLLGLAYRATPAAMAGTVLRKVLHAKIVAPLLLVVASAVVWAVLRPNDNDTLRHASTEVSFDRTARGAASRDGRLSSAPAPADRRTAIIETRRDAPRAVEATTNASDEQSVRGRVVSVDGEGVRGARVRLVPRAPLSAAEMMGRSFDIETDSIKPLAETRSGVDGAFELASVPAGIWTVTATAPAWNAAQVDVSLRAGHAASALIRLAPARRVRCQLVDAQAGPVVGAWLAYTGPWAGATASDRVETDEEGMFELGVALDDDAPLVRIWVGPDCELIAPLPLDGDPIVLPPRVVRVLAVVQAPSGEALAGARVQVGLSTNHTPPMQVRLSGTTDAAGRMRLACCNGTVVAVTLSHAATGRLVLVGREFLPQGAAGLRAKTPLTLTKDTHEIVLEAAPSIVIRGVVRDEAGHPLEGAVVQVSCGVLNSAPVRTDANGAYVVGHTPVALMPVFAHVRATYPGLIQSRGMGQLPAGPITNNQEIDLTMTTGHTLRGRIVDVDGQAVALAVVAVLVDPDIHAVGAATPRVLSGPDGGFVIPGLPQDPHVHLDISHAQYAGQRTRCRLQPGSHSDVGTLVLSRGHTCEIFVETDDGEPVPYARVALREDARVGRVERAEMSALGVGAHAFIGGEVRVMIADRTGRARFSQLSSGAYELRVRSTGGLTVRAPLVMAEQDVRRAVQLSAQFDVRGTVSSNGEPVVGARLRAADEKPEVLELIALVAGPDAIPGPRSGAQGDFHLARHSAADVQILVDAEGYYLETVVARGGSRDLQIDLHAMSPSEIERLRELRAGIRDLVKEMSTLDPRKGIQLKVIWDFMKARKQILTLRTR